MERAVVKNLVEEAIAENSRLFLIDLNFLPDNKIIVTLDGDDGVSVKECVRISRHVEHNLDREEEDFSLDVTTPGATTPFTNSRQYKKNVGRVLKVKTETENFEGTLTEANDDEIILEWKVREPKPIGKGKVTVVKKATLKYTSIKEAKVKIIF
jgi:ribosome maturation factor RimP